MSHEVETIAYNRVEVPWHGLGNPTSGDRTPEEMCEDAGILWTVSKRDLRWTDNKGRLGAVPKFQALVRDSDDHVLSVIGKNWKPTQNTEAMDFFSKFVAAGQMKMETAGSLKNGQYIWGLARIDKSFYVDQNKTDEVMSYLLMMSPHLFGCSMVFQYTGTRVVCWNTLNMALG